MNVDSDVPVWSTEPFLLLPTHAPDKAIELVKSTLPQDGDFVPDPLVINERSTEYTLWAQNPILIEYYDLRNPKRDASTAGVSQKSDKVALQRKLNSRISLLCCHFYKRIASPTYKTSYFHVLKTSKS